MSRIQSALLVATAASNPVGDDSVENPAPVTTDRKTSLNLTQIDLTRAARLGLLIGRKATRTEVIRRALALLFFAFDTKQGDELVVMRRGKEVARLEWADSVAVAD